MTPGVHRQVPFGSILDNRRKVHFPDANKDQFWFIGQKVHFQDANSDQFQLIREVREERQSSELRLHRTKQRTNRRTCERIANCMERIKTKERIAGCTIRFENRMRHRIAALNVLCLLYTSPSPRDRTRSRMPSSA